MCSARAKNSQSPASSHGEALALGGFSITKETHDTRRTRHANPCTLWLHCGEKPLAVAPAVALNATLKTKGKAYVALPPPSFAPVARRGSLEPFTLSVTHTGLASPTQDQDQDFRIG